jgi:hypothetical protein
MSGIVGTLGLVVGLAFASGLTIGLLIKYRAGGMAFWRLLLSDDNGKSSFSRFSSLVVLLVSMSWISWEIHAQTSMVDVATLIKEVTPFDVTILGILYGVNKVGAMVTGVKSNGKPAAPAPGGDNK